MEIYQVAKTVITIDVGAVSHYLMSVKRDPGTDNHRKLEFLGGRFESGESPRDALLRELSEEERSGGLARIAADRVGLFFRVQTDNADQFVFPLHLTPAEFGELAHHPHESFGFRLMECHRIKPCPKSLTRKTNAILEAVVPGH